MKSHLFAYALMLSAAGCFDPDLAASSFKCDPTGDQTDVCPDGQACNSQGVCVASGSPNATPDMAGMMPMPPMLVPNDACPLMGTAPGQGYLVSQAGKAKVYACPVKYSRNAGMTADAQCKAPYQLCNSAANIDLATCSSVGQSTKGFFIANVRAYRRNSNGPITCGNPSFGNELLWVGCGRTEPTLSKCQDFFNAIDCSQSSTAPITCSGYQIGDVTNNQAASGVLCCSPN